jgi:putative ABC transport system permease protein
MLKNYFKIAWRNIVKHRFYSFVNIVGLFTGITFALLIGAYVWQELQVNKELRNYKQQFFLQTQWKDDAQSGAITTFAPLAKRLKEEYPNLIVNFYRWDGITSGVTKGDKSFREDIQLGDSTLLSMFGFELLHGDKQTALMEPYSAVITEQTAIRYFGKTNVVGQTLIIQSFSGGEKDFAITGVLKTQKENSVTRLNADNRNTVFIPTNTYDYFSRTSLDNWNNFWIPSYIELKEGASVVAVQQAIEQLIKTNLPDAVKPNFIKVEAVPLSNYYLHKDNGLVKRMLYMLSFIGLFILLMAVVNFINIAISSSGNRMKEIGMRKVMGSMRWHLIIQFLAESLLLALLATALATAAYPFAKNIFADIIGKELPMLLSFPVYFIIIPLSLAVIVGLLAGIYPSIILSALSTTTSLKGKLKTAGENIWLRKSLVGFQFCIALLVLIAAMVVTQQVNHFFSKQLGYNKEYVVASQVPRDWSPAGVQKLKTIRNEFAAMPQVNEVSMSYEIPNGNNGGGSPVYKLGNDSTTAITMQALVTDENYLKTYGISINEGDFFESRSLDSGKVVLNEKAVAVLGYKNSSDAIGKQLRIPGDPTIFTVKGIVNDFHFFSMQQSMPPIIFFNVYNSLVHRYLSFKLKPGNIPASVEAIQKKWTALMPGSSFEYIFIDDALKKVYANELQIKKASYAATLLTFIIALLGVLGLVSLSIHKRVKEIGVRKVLGASLPNIIMLFVKEFIVVLLIAVLVVCPIAYVLMKQWLHNYANRISITATPFIFAATVLISITILVIALQTFKTAKTNPAKSLKTE